ncbi:MAG: beta-ketoacyl-[acyl-carrier-protein] synthase family protein [Nitrospirota bacterium]
MDGVYMHQRRKVAVVGLGAVSALGMTVSEYWEGLIAGRCGIGPMDLFDTSAYRTHIGAQVRDMVPSRHFSKKELRRMSRCDQIGIIAAREAIRDSGLDLLSVDPEIFGVILGGGAGGMLSGEKYRRDLKERVHRPRPSLLIPFSPSVTTDMVAAEFGCLGPRSTVVTACSSSSTSIGYAADVIRDGEADIVITGGSDAMCELTYSGFNALRAVDERPCRPFDAERKGLSLGEGAGMLVLEEAGRAKARGARIYAELAGYGIAGDAFHMTAPETGGEGAARTIAAALQDAGAVPEDVDYINAHGTATRFNDASETAAIKKILGEHAYNVSVSSIKSMIGHCLGSAGGLEAVATVLSVFHGVIPPTIHYMFKDPLCDLDYTPNHARPRDIRLAISNSLAFGGNNTTIVIRKA